MGPPPKRLIWLDARGQRLPLPLFPGFDTPGTLAHIGQTGHEHTWLVVTRKIIEREFARSGSEQNPDITGKSIRGVHTDLLGRVLTERGDPLPGLWAAGEAAGFGGGGMHGYRSLEGTFLGGCRFSGRVAGRALSS